VHTKSRASCEGFTLVEMLVSLLIGTLVLGVAVDIFSRSIAATWVVSQKAEMQQDARAAINLMTKDIRFAGGGLPSGGVALAAGTGVTPAYGLDYNGTGYLGSNNNAGVNFPIPSGSTIPFLYGALPGCGKGITLNAGQGATDIITVAYLDSTFPLQDYQVTFNNTNGTSVTFTSTNAADPGVNSTAVGLQQGDLVLFQAQIGSGSSATAGYAIADVTAPAGVGGGPTYTVLFANNDALKLNQTAATSNDLKQIVSNVGAVDPGAIAKRIWVITYYLWNQPNPAGGTAIPVLMRQVNGRKPVPVAENVVNLRFTYDTYDSSGNLLNATCDGGQAGGVSPNEIRTINIVHLTFRGQLAGTRSSLSMTRGYQSVDLQATLSARNLSFSQRYQ
jgi:prepilin-type N-terminal cleavage/methylation domain-containing protein